jgi:predicted PurR-regulated permease PerM
MDTSQSSERGFGFLQRIRWKRLAFWGIFLGLLFVLRDFFDVLFLSFVFTYIFGNAVTGLSRLLRREGSESFRKGLTLGFYVLLVGGLGTGIYVAYPHLVMQGRVVLDRVGHLSAAAQPGAAEKPGGPAWSRERVEKLLEQLLGKEQFTSFKGSAIYGPTVGATQNLLNAVLPGLGQRVARFLQDFLRWMLHFFLALVFSLIILLDLPKLREQVSLLRTSQVGAFYAEIAPSLSAFGAILGKAFQAQALIAVVNTALTLAGILILDLPHPLLLTGIVFVCSFIPVLGVIISTIPMALMAIQSGGAMQVLYVVLWVMGVHAVEAYVLNPKIVGGFMHMHPVLVLVILVVAEHLFGLWGLLLGVPVCFYLYHHWIKGDSLEIAAMPMRSLRVR